MKGIGARILLSIGFLLLFYIAGVVVRGQYGIRIVINNQSGQALSHVALKEETHGPRHELGDLPIGFRKRIFVQPKTESHIVLGFQDVTGAQHSETVVGYVEDEYCGNAEVAVEPDGKVMARERIDILLCKGSWLDFVR